MFIPKSWGWQVWNYDASITSEEAKCLLTDEKFVDVYLNCIGMYINALEDFGWNNYPVRYARMLQSLALFLQAANKMEDLNMVAKLREFGVKALNYASKYVIPSNKQYALLNEGYSATKFQMELALAEDIVCDEILSAEP